ncbi:MAG: AsmA family protein [Gammaproteobacteria bacterium]|nr:AsmA family protein [Gammaproteobacteria bacterium]
MIKYIKIVALFLALILLIPIATIYTLPHLINTEALKAQITTAVETHTERKLAIPGNIKFSFYPKIELEINNLELSSIEGFDEQPFARIEKMVLRVKLLPLLQNQLSIQHITLNQLKLNLSKNSHDENNWDSIIKALQKNSLFQNPIEKLEINQATIQWKNNLINTFYTIDNLFIETNKLTFNHAFKVKSRFNLTTHQNQFSKSIALTSYIKLDPDLKHYDFNQSHITIQSKNKNSPAAKELPPFIFTAQDTTLNLSKQTLSIPAWSLQLLDAEIQGETSAVSLLNSPEFSGKIKTSSFNPRDIFEKLGYEFYIPKNSSALTEVLIKSKYTATLDSFIANDFYMRFDSAILKGFIEINSFNNPAIDFSLNLNKLAINHYVPEKNYPVAEWPLKSLRKLNLRGILNIESLGVSNITAGDVQIALLAENDLFQITRLESIIHGGKLEGEITLNIKTDKPTLNGHLQIIGLNPRSMLEEWSKISLETPNIDALHRLDLSLQIDSTQMLTKLSKIEVKLDKSSAEGVLNIAHASTPKVTTNFNIDHINLDHYLHQEQIKYGTLFTTTISNTLNSTLNIEQLTAFGQKCETITIQKIDIDTQPYLITIIPKKSKKREIKGDHFSKILDTLMKSQCLKEPI